MKKLKILQTKKQLETQQDENIEWMFKLISLNQSNYPKKQNNK